MAINWNDPSRNYPADVDALRQFIADTDPTVNQSHLYQPTKKQNDDGAGFGGTYDKDNPFAPRTTHLRG